jgi:predicted transposase/invertase (TIGR01784 family)
MSKTLVNPHDAFFKQTLSDPRLAGTFLREHLPPEVAELLGPEAPEPVAGSFVDEQLRQHHSDLLFRVRLKTGDDAFAHVLLEHKSSPDRGARLQLLRYVVRVLVDFYEHNEPQLPLPPVVPLLAHQGPEGWSFSCEFADLFGSVPEPLRPYLPSFRHALVDLTRIDDRELSAEARLRAFLKALKYCRRRDLDDCIQLVFAQASILDDNDLMVISTYLNKGSEAMNKAVLEQALEHLPSERHERIVRWLTQPEYEKAKAEGKAEGKAEVEAECVARILTRLLEKRFGSVPPSVRQRVFAADMLTVEAWVERAVDAPDLQSVFESSQEQSSAVPA